VLLSSHKVLLEAIFAAKSNFLINIKKINVGWYEPGTLPGAPGNPVLAGHVDDLISPAVFYDLLKLKKGNKIMVTGTEGKTLTFEIYDRKHFRVWMRQSMRSLASRCKHA
jgi:hypothetical protein